VHRGEEGPSGRERSWQLLPQVARWSLGGLAGCEHCIWSCWDLWVWSAGRLRLGAVHSQERWAGTLGVGALGAAVGSAAIRQWRLLAWAKLGHQSTRRRRRR
jgi:hypothetical protein